MLSSLILQHILIRPLNYTRRPSRKTSRVFPQTRAPPPGLDSDELHSLVLDKFVKDADGIRSAADARDDRLGQFAFRLKNLRARLPPDDFVKVPHHGGIRMGAEHAAQKIVCRAYIGHPVAHGLVDRVL